MSFFLFSVNASDKKTLNEQPSDTEKCMNACKDKFNQILLHVPEEKNQEAHKMEESVFRQLWWLLLVENCI
ncbi:MAG: hypothetical protein GY795_34095 [Desulfobacterales bacterium]|nr:hypothetical protein [Desulfobacterales bacterium]